MFDSPLKEVARDTDRQTWRESIPEQSPEEILLQATGTLNPNGIRQNGHNDRFGRVVLTMHNGIGQYFFDNVDGVGANGLRTEALHSDWLVKFLERGCYLLVLLPKSAIDSSWWTARHAEFYPGAPRDLSGLGV